MKISIHLTERVTYRWPLDYWIELIRKLTKAGHEIYALSDEPYVQIKDENSRLFDRLHLSDDLSRIVVAQSDLFIGPPLKYFDMAMDLGKRTIVLQASEFKGEGIRSTAQCAGCREKMEHVNDCLWEDDLCQWEITPNDVLSVVNA